MDVSKSLTQLIQELRSIPYINTSMIEAFTNRIAENHFSKEDNEKDHFGAFFIPYHVDSNSVYMGHHQKSGVWLLPGGHIDLNETPIQTVQREYGEELGVPLSTEPITLVNIEITHPGYKGHACVTHYDFWFRVDVNEQVPFNFSKREYYTAKWVTIEEARALNVVKHYDKIIKDIPLRPTSAQHA